ncbi:MAG: phosphatidylserine decarboxylase family protein [Bacteroidetes bacterium HGW-Bacteroidetes-21]|jgi:phosphatidylserine decarboxylase|nr:MAG: phosphatidylserine decarboxylase family protein [Bacteroidetes bacterium HGW-Bacteroidetes-21]
MRIHREGNNTIVFSLVLISLISTPVWLFCDIMIINITVSVLLGLFFYFILHFFRYPVRSSGEVNDNTVLCPCDGEVVSIEKITENEYFKSERIQVSVFMSPLNVHINWAPVKGIVSYSKYHKGKYLVAWHPKSSTENERTTVVFKTLSGQEVMARQIAGAVARRIVCYANKDSEYLAGDEFGFIKFGSRVDIILPVDAQIHVAINQVVSGVNTVIASLSA